MGTSLAVSGTKNHSYLVIEGLDCWTFIGQLEMKTVR